MAASAIDAGMANCVLVYRAFNERSGRRFGQPHRRRAASRVAMSWYLPFGLDTPAKMYALWFQRYMHEYGVTNEDFGRYTVVARQHAATNPNAWFYERPITLDDHQTSRWIVEPILRLLDCCQESDGGVAAASSRRPSVPATSRNPPVRDRRGRRSRSSRSGNVMFNYYHDDLADFPEAAVGLAAALPHGRARARRHRRGA